LDRGDGYDEKIKYDYLGGKMQKQRLINLALLIIMAVFVVACGQAAPEPTEEPTLKVGVVLDAGGDTDKGFNEYTLAGARGAAEAAGLEFEHVVSGSPSDQERNVARAAEDSDLVITVGFPMAEATAKVAREHPDTQFAIIDTAYFPGLGCPDSVDDCYTEEGGLANITSLVFAEDEVGYLAGVLAGCMSETGTVGVVAGMEIPPVVRFVTGYQNGARSVKPDIVTLSEYIPDFNDPETGRVVGQSFISQGVDVIFGAGGNTGNGGLLAAHEAGLMAIGVDVDQYFTYPDVQTTLLSSASKKVDVAAATVVEQFAAGQLKGGIQVAALANNGVGLAPFHDWDGKIPQECKDRVKAAEEAIKADPTITGGK
jgi:basic membrane lipoprotein Med (substrate-binding protein (PBP1-ABC) superfamily)